MSKPVYMDNIIQEGIERIVLVACNNLLHLGNQDVGTWLQKISYSKSYLEMLSCNCLLLKCCRPYTYYVLQSHQTLYSWPSLADK